jgi:hypothetical protein
MLSFYGKEGRIKLKSQLQTSLKEPFFNLGSIENITAEMPEPSQIHSV